jgi:hypothetical protein
MQSKLYLPEIYGNGLDSPLGVFIAKKMEISYMKC